VRAARRVGNYFDDHDDDDDVPVPSNVASPVSVPRHCITPLATHNDTLQGWQCILLGNSVHASVRAAAGVSCGEAEVSWLDAVCRVTYVRLVMYL